jgi:hypothetical protein
MNIDELKEIMEEDFPVSPGEITTLEEAAEAQRRIQYFEGKIQEVVDVANAQTSKLMEQMGRIDEWEAKEIETHRSRINFYKGQLQSYLTRQVYEARVQGKNPKKSLKLPYGSIAFKSQQPEYVKDDELLMRYAKENGFIKVKEEVDWKALKDSCSIVDGKLVDANGEVVRGVEVRDREDKFEVKLKDVE